MRNGFRAIQIVFYRFSEACKMKVGDKQLHEAFISYSFLAWPLQATICRKPT